jgi:hypothetical protein
VLTASKREHTSLEASDMKIRDHIRRLAAVASVAVVAGAFWPARASAEELSDKWKVGAAVYGWMPKLSGTVTVPGTSPVDFDINFSTLLENLDFGGMASIEAQKGHWGVFTDVIYLDLGTDKTTTRGGSIDGVSLPVTIDVTQNVDLKGWLLTLGPSYRVVAKPGSTLDVFAGAGMLWLKPTLKLDLSADFGNFSGPGRSVSRSTTSETWNAIVGFKGRQGLGASHKWSIPYYANIGTGQSDFTVQVAGGIAYAFSWGEVAASWRYLDYNQKSTDALQSLKINGPLVGVGFHW